MWSNKKNFTTRGFLTPPPTWKSGQTDSVAMPISERKRISPAHKVDLFHIIHKVPAGDSPYVRAKHVQLIEKDPSRAISLFWAAINAGDRVDSALKDMAVVMKQLDRSDEAIEAIKSFRHLCPYESQESLDNVLIELYKRSGRVEEEIQLLQHKLMNIEEGVAFGGKKTKMVKSQGKKTLITIEQEKSRILGNLAWAYLQQHNYGIAEQHYRKALSLEPDMNKQCNLAICLMHMNRINEAKSLLQDVRDLTGNKEMDESYAKSYERAFQMLTEMESQQEQNRRSNHSEDNLYGNGKESSKWISFGLKVSSDNWSRSSHSETPCATSNFASRMNRNHVLMTETDVSSSHKNAYASPAPVRRNSGVLFTQPRSCSQGFNSGDKGGCRWGENRVGSSVRKLSFEKAITTENVHSHATQNLNEELATSIDENSENEHNLEGSSGITVSRYVNSTNTVLDEQNVHSHATQNLNEELATSIDENSENEHNLEGSSGITVSRYVNSTNTVLDECFSLDNTYNKSDDLHQLINANPKSSEDCSVGKAKKTWADIAEEEEEEEEKEELMRKKKQSNYYPYGCNSEEEFNDENLDSNIMYQSHYPQSQTETLSQELGESLDLKYEYGTSGNGFSSRNTAAVRRSLCFEGYNSVPVKEKDSLSGKDINVKRRNRLKVFQEITLLPDSS